MTQTNNRFFDEIGRLMNEAAGAAQGVKREVDTVVRNQAEKILRDLDVVKREEFEAVKDMARLAREENEALKARIALLEARVGAPPAVPPTMPPASPAPSRMPPPTMQDASPAPSTAPAGPAPTTSGSQTEPVSK